MSPSFSSVPILTIGFFIVWVGTELIIENDFQSRWRDRCRETVVGHFPLILVVTVNLSSHVFPEIYNEWNPIQSLRVFIFIDLACICKSAVAVLQKAVWPWSCEKKQKGRRKRTVLLSWIPLCAREYFFCTAWHAMRKKRRKTMSPSRDHPMSGWNLW